MYQGHLAVALAARRLSPTTPIAALAAAAIASDLADVVLSPASADVAIHTHTVPGALGLSIAVALIGWIAAGRRAAVVLGALAASHVPLDYVTSRLLVWPGGPRIGLGLYAHPAIDLAVEATVIAAGWSIYRGSLPAPRRTHASVVAIAAIMLALQVTFALVT
jgi:hypothetical protein